MTTSQTSQDKLQWRLCDDSNLKCWCVYFRLSDKLGWINSGPVRTEQEAAQVVANLEQAYGAKAERYDCTVVAR